MLLLALLAVACREVPTIDLTAPSPDPFQEQMIGANKLISKGEEGQIEAYIGRRGWQMERLANGVRMMETGTARPGQPRLEYDDTVVLRYRVETISGETLYTDCCDTVVVGRLKPNRGIDAALRHLRDGSSAVVVVPSEQGFGVIGDGNRIGSRIILIYTLSVTRKDIKQQ